MTQEAETVAMELNIVSCQTCDAVFIESERRQTCPSCGGPPVGPYFRFVLDGSGLHQKDGVRAPPINREEAVQQLKDLSYPEEEAEAMVDKWNEDRDAAAEAPAATAPVEEEAPAGGLGDLPPSDVFPLTVASYLRGGEATGDDLRGMLTDLGAEREAATTAVGRLEAVRDLLQELAAAGVEAQVEVTVEEAPAEAPSPAGEPAEGEPAAAPEPETAEGGEESQPPEAV